MSRRLKIIIPIILIAIYFSIPLIKGYNFQNFIKKTHQLPQLQNTTFTITAKYLDQDDYLIEYNSDEPIHPGSNFKLFTAVSLLENLPSDYKIPTDFKITPENNLLVIGHGDPTFNTTQIPELTKKLQAYNWQGQTILYNDQYFRGEQYGPNWNEEWKKYSTAIPISALQINDSLLSVLGNKNQEISTFPYTTINQIIDQRDYKNSFNQIINSTNANLDLQNNILTITGDTIPNLPFEISIPVTNPSLFTAKVISQELNKSGFNITNQNPTTSTEGTELYTHFSNSLSSIIQNTLKFSLNHYAESLVRILGEQITPNQPDSQAAGVKILQATINQIPNITITAKDGSGMSYSTTTTSRSIVNLLEYIEKQPYRDIIIEALPTAQQDGTLKTRFKNLQLQSTIIGKTGTHIGANTLSGKIIQKDGDQILFSINISNHGYTVGQAQKAIIPIIDQLVYHLDRQF